MTTDSTDGRRLRRRWLAITVATVVYVFSYSFVVAAFVAAGAEEGPAPGPLLAFGLALMPFVFLVLAFGSGNRRAPGATMRALLLSVLVAVPVSALAQDIVSGLVAGFGAGGIVALRLDEGHSLRARSAAVVLATLYVFVIVRLIPGAGLLAGAILPFLSIGLADYVTEQRARSAGRGS